MSIALLHLADGFEETEAIATADVLKRAGIDTRLVSMNKTDEVTGSHGITIKTDIMFEDADYDTADAIVLPGGMPGSKNLKDHNGLKEKIVEFYEKDKICAAICAAPMAFANAGILEGKKATCYPAFEDELNGAKLSRCAVVQDGNIITSRGVGTALKFGLKLVEVMVGKDTAKKLQEAMLVK